MTIIRPSSILSVEQPPSRSSSPSGLPLVLFLVVVVFLAGIAAAQTSDSLFKDFEPTGDYILLVDGEDDTKAEIYYQRRIPAFLVLPSKSSSPFLLVPRTKTVQSVHIMKISKQSNGNLDLLADAVFAQKGQFDIEGTSITFAVDGHDFQLRDKPPLLGLQPASGLEEYSDDYVRLAQSYSPDANAIKALEAEERDVHVRVYFGSWCPYCQRYVPRIVRVTNELKSSRIVIDFYGLPTTITSDPVAREMNVKGVPTGVVFVDGKEVGRLRQDDWKRPESAIQKLLAR